MGGPEFAKGPRLEPHDGDRQDIVAMICDEVARRGYKRVILLGAMDVMSGPSLKIPLAKAGLAVLVPGTQDRDWLARVIDEELGQGVVSDETLARFARLMADGAEHGVDAVIVGLPELKMLMDRIELGLAVICAWRVCGRAQEGAAAIEGDQV